MQFFIYHEYLFNYYWHNEFLLRTKVLTRLISIAMKYLLRITYRSYRPTYIKVIPFAILITNFSKL